MHTQNVFARLRLPRKARKLTRFRTAAKYGQAEELPPANRNRVRNILSYRMGRSPAEGQNLAVGPTPAEVVPLDMRGDLTFVLRFAPPRLTR